MQLLARAEALQSESQSMFIGCLALAIPNVIEFTVAILAALLGR